MLSRQIYANSIQHRNANHKPGGDLPGYGPVWYDPEAIANVLSSKLVKEKYYIHCSSEHNGFVVTKPDVKVFTFTESCMGLHYLNTSNPTHNLSPDHINGNMFMVNTVAGNKANCTNND